MRAELLALSGSPDIDAAVIDAMLQADEEDVKGRKRRRIKQLRRWRTIN